MSDIPQPAQFDNATWLRERRQGIGGSDIPKLLGLSKWGSPLTVYHSKIEQQPVQDGDEDSEHESAFWGKTLEPIVADEFSRRTGLHTMPATGIHQSHDYPFLLASLDRYVLADVHAEIDAFLEVKTRSSYADKPWENGVPADVLVQVQEYLLVTGFREAWVAVLLGGQKLRIFRVDHDLRIQALIVDAAGELWDRVVNRRPPEETSIWKNAADRIWPTVKVESIRVDKVEGLLDLLVLHNDLSFQIRGLQEQLDDTEGRIKMLLGSAGTGKYENRIAVTYREEPERWFNVERLRLDDPHAADRYTEVRRSRVLRVKALKGTGIE